MSIYRETSGRFYHFQNQKKISNIFCNKNFFWSVFLFGPCGLIVQDETMIVANTFYQL